MRILMVTPDLDPGGAQLAMVRLASGLAASHDIVVYAMTRPAQTGPLEQALRAAGVRVVAGPFRGLIERIARRLSLLDRLHVRRLRALHRRFAFEVVNGHQAAAERIACRAFAGDKVPLIGTDHGCYRALLAPVSGLGRREDYAEVFQRSDGLICPSRDNLQIAARHSWKSGFRTWKIHYGYPLPQAVPPDRPARGDAPFVFGMIARGIPEKGWNEAVAAFLRLRESSKRPLRLRLAGDGPGLDALRRTLAPGESRGIEFLGHVDDVPALLRGIDAGLLPTWFELESLPNTVIEYLAHGVPVVTTPIGGIPEMLEHPDGPAGILVPLDPATGRARVDALTEAMRRLATNEPLRRQLATRGREAARKFDLAHAVARYSEVFREAAGLPAAT